MSIHTKNAGRTCALLVFIIGMGNTVLYASDQELAPDYGLGPRYVDAPDEGQPLPVIPPGEYRPPKLLAGEGGEVASPPLEDKNDLKDEAPEQWQEGEGPAADDGEVDKSPLLLD